MNKKIYILVIIFSVSLMSTACRGPKGSSGAKGAPGMNGTPGTNGVNGVKGEKGEPGASSPVESQVGGYSGGGHAIKENSAPLLEYVKKELIQHLKFSSDIIYKDLPNTWTKKDLINVISKISEMPANKKSRREDLVFDYDYDSDTKLGAIYATNNYFLTYAQFPYRNYERKSLVARDEEGKSIAHYFTNDQKLQIEGIMISMLHELAHLVYGHREQLASKSDQELDQEARSFAYKILTAIERDYIGCVTEEEVDYWFIHRDLLSEQVGPQHLLFLYSPYRRSYTLTNKNGYAAIIEYNGKTPEKLEDKLTYIKSKIEDQFINMDIDLSQISYNDNIIFTEPLNPRTISTLVDPVDPKIKVSTNNNTVLISEYIHYISLLDFRSEKQHEEVPEYLQIYVELTHEDNGFNTAQIEYEQILYVEELIDDSLPDKVDNTRFVLHKKSGQFTLSCESLSKPINFAEVLTQ
ncbi:MAG: collagen-like protein [Bdellovibrionales bacterium]|nr:collagen-like protein [Bdellovibrionales bacterium]